MATTTDSSAVLVIKERGNDHFKRGEINEASVCYEEALTLLSSQPDHHGASANERVAVLKNLAACRLKQEQYDEVVRLCSECIELSNDPKALYRRAVAYEALGREDLAMKDAKQLRTAAPNDKQVQELLTRLSQRLDDRIRQYATNETKGQQMLQLLTESGVDLEKRRLAAQNFVAIANESHGAEYLVQSKSLAKLASILADDAANKFARLDRDVRLSLVRTLSAACRNSEQRARYFVQSPDVKLDSLLLSLLGSNDSDLIVACILVLENVLRALSEWPHNPTTQTTTTSSGTTTSGNIKIHSSHHTPAGRGADDVETSTTPATVAAAVAREGYADSVYRKTKPNLAAMERNKSELDSVMGKLVSLIDSPKISANARKNLINLIILCMPRSAVDTGLGYTMSIISVYNGIERLLRVSVTSAELQQSPDTTATLAMRRHASLALAKLYDDLESDKERSTYREHCEQFINQLLTGDAEIATKVQAIEAITTLLQGPFDVGNFFLGRAGIIEMIMTLAGRGDEYQQLVAVEALVSSAQKKDKVSALLDHGLGLLKQLYKESKSRAVKVRALVGLCRLAAAHGTDVSLRKVSDENLSKLAEVCCKFLAGSEDEESESSTKAISSTITAADYDTRKWAAEGLSYLTLDADVKELLINNKPAVRALVDMSRSADPDTVYAIATIFVNVVNAYDKGDETIPELIELAKFAKQHVPEQHPLDSQEHVVTRIVTLVHELNAFSALSQLTHRADSNNVRELIARALLNMLEARAHCGIAAQQGVPKALIELALTNGTVKGKDAAAQGLARIAVHVNPETAFPGQRVYEVIRPLTRLLRPEKTGLQNFEALLALTNIASVSESVRERIISVRDDTHGPAISSIEAFMYEEHYELRRAAVQCVCNLLLNDSMANRYISGYENATSESGTDRIKLLVLFALEEEDDALNAAAAGALCQLTSYDADDERGPVACEAVVKSTPSWPDMLKRLLMSENAELRFRGAYLAANLVERGAASVAQMVVESDVMDVLNATLAFGNEANKAKVEPQVLRAMEAARKRGLVVRNAA